MFLKKNDTEVRARVSKVTVDLLGQSQWECHRHSYLD